MCTCVFARAWQAALEQARAVRMAGSVGIPGAPPPYSDTMYVQAYPGPNGGYYRQHPPPYGRVTMTVFASKLCFAASCINFSDKC